MIISQWNVVENEFKQLSMQDGSWVRLYGLGFDSQLSYPWAFLFLPTSTWTILFFIFPYETITCWARMDYFLHDTAWYAGAAPESEIVNKQLKLPKEIVIAQQEGILDPMFVKPKCAWEVALTLEHKLQDPKSKPWQAYFVLLGFWFLCHSVGKSL